jgi:hypothetical protein
MRRTVHPALCLALVVAGLAACASVLGVDKQYELGPGDAGEDAGPASAPEMRCAPDGSLCQAGTQECCMASDYTLSCVSIAPTNPCPNGTDIVCNQPADCASGICCINLDQGNDILGTTCRTSCQTGELALCAPEGGACTQGQCTPVNVQPNPPIKNPWFYSCQ